MAWTTPEQLILLEVAAGGQEIRPDQSENAAATVDWGTVCSILTSKKYRKDISDSIYEVETCREQFLKIAKENGVSTQNLNSLRSQRIGELETQIQKCSQAIQTCERDIGSIENGEHDAILAASSVTVKSEKCTSHDFNYQPSTSPRTNSSPSTHYTSDPLLDNSTFIHGSPQLTLAGMKRKREEIESGNHPLPLSLHEGHSSETEMPALSLEEVADPEPATTSSAISTSRRFSDSVETLKERLIEACHALSSHEDSGPFLEPVVGVAQYDNVIKDPMDLTEVGKRIENEVITTPLQLYCHLALIVQNACTFNSRKTEFYKMAKRLEAFGTDDLQIRFPEDAHLIKVSAATPTKAAQLAASLVNTAPVTGRSVSPATSPKSDVSASPPSSPPAASARAAKPPPRSSRRSRPTDKASALDHDKRTRGRPRKK